MAVRLVRAREGSPGGAPAVRGGVSRGANPMSAGRGQGHWECEGEAQVRAHRGYDLTAEVGQFPELGD